MRVNSGYNPYPYQQQKAAAKKSEFAETLSDAAAPRADTISFSAKKKKKASSLALRLSLDFKFECLADLLRSNCRMNDQAMIAMVLAAMRTGKPVDTLMAALTEEQTDV